LLAAALALGFAAPPTGAVYGASDSADAAATTADTGGGGAPAREEVIYANLTTAGAPEKVYAVTLLHPDGVRLYDYGTFENVMNLTDTTTVRQTEDGVVVQSDAKDFYYQADLPGKQLPWHIDISYTLDGKPADPAGLAGKSGALEVRIHTAPVISDNVFSKNDMLQITVTLDAIRCADIASETAQIASSGTDRVLSFVTLPDKDQTHAFTAEVRDFEMDGIQIAAVPFAMKLEENQEEDMEELDDGTADLLEASVDIKDGLKEVSDKLKEADFEGKKDSFSFDDGSSMFDSFDLSGLKQLPKSLNKIADGIDQVAAGLLQLQDGVSLAYGAADGAIGLLPDGSGADAMKQDIEACITSAAQQAGAAAAMQTAAAGGDAAAQAAAAEAAGAALAGQLAAALQPLNDAYAAAVTARLTWDGVGGVPGAKAGVSAATTAPATMAEGLGMTAEGLRLMASELQTSLKDFDMDDLKRQAQEKTAKAKADLTKEFDQLEKDMKKLRDGLAELSDGYREFHDGLLEYTDGITELTDALKEKDFVPTSFISEKNGGTAAVQFVMKTAEIRVPDEPEAAAAEDPAAPTGLAGLIARIKALFGR
ncbi:MAG: hypothetical protein LBR00_04455, partial [Clostridiales Family XIII bacterium]|nr:hypothetical protein [Clostridiales Family XIII bacterium]